ncbi:MAG TPA: alkaline phosphatase family protein [Terriglobales bacterium]|nr:alkaline phosphatase family protein [Terriglobales bacterium]
MKLCISVFAMALAVMLTGCAGIRGEGSTPPRDSAKTKINHIILMMQENRSFDHYLGRLNDYRAARGLPRDVDDLTKLGAVALPTWDGTPDIGLFKMNSACTGDMSSSWVESKLDIDVHNPTNPAVPPPMNGFAYTAGGFAEHDPTHGGFDVSGHRAMGYYDADQLPFYYWAATQFATSDRWFSAALTRTQPNRMYFLAATSNGYAFPGDGQHPPIDMTGVKNIFQLLEENKITWKVYVTDGWQPGSTGSTYMNFFADFTSQHKDKFVDAKQFAIDAQAGTLPQVALIESGYIETGTDEHPLNPVDKGAMYVRTLVKALMNSPSWKDSVFFLTYDEGGGLYDHVPPVKTVSPDGKKPYLLPTDFPGDFDVTGFRVPLFIFSPFAKPGYVSHTNADFTALLKFVEKRFDLPNLMERDKAQPDMDEYFDWAGPNLTSTSPPEQPTLPCYFDRLP